MLQEASMCQSNPPISFTNKSTTIFTNNQNKVSKKIEGQKYFGCFHPTFNSTNFKS
jgi:hypothetical protein